MVEGNWGGNLVVICQCQVALLVAYNQKHVPSNINGCQADSVERIYRISMNTEIFASICTTQYKPTQTHSHTQCRNSFIFTYHNTIGNVSGINSIRPNIEKSGRGARTFWFIRKKTNEINWINGKNTHTTEKRLSRDMLTCLNNAHFKYYINWTFSLICKQALHSARMWILRGDCPMSWKINHYGEPSKDETVENFL